MSSIEMREKSVCLGSSHVAVAYPQTLDTWFDGLVESQRPDIAPAKWVRLRHGDGPGRFELLTSVDAPAEGLDLGEALAAFWERVSFLLVDELNDAFVLHAAALRQKTTLILLPGCSGSGKTRLALWYQAQGFNCLTDEIAATSFGSNGGLVLNGALARPVVLKQSAEASEILRPGEMPAAQQDSAYGLIMKLGVSGTSRSPAAIDCGLIVFPHFTRGVPLKLTALTPGEASLRLLENCLNSRNLTRGGLPLAGLLARHLQAVSLDYGETSQLEGTLDVLTRRTLAASMSFDDLAALCEAFTARAAVRISAGKNGKRAEVFPDPPANAVPAPAVTNSPPRLTIGMSTFDDFDGAYFTIQSIRMNNPELHRAVEFVVIDNNPGGASSEALRSLKGWIDGYRYIPRGDWHGTAMRNAVFEEASSPFVLCIDSHVLLAPGALSKLIAYLEAHPDSRDLLQGPLVYDDMRSTSTHMEAKWRDGMWGTWANDPRGSDPTGSGFEIPMHGLGLFASRRKAWAGFNPMFRGFGGEEGYIHEKTRRRGGQTICLPFLVWMHRFGRPKGVPYLNAWEDRIRNYVIGFRELGLDTAEMEAHFGELLGAETSATIFRQTRAALENN